MTPDELRALADALEPMAKAPCFDGININRAAAYLRQCADAQAEPKREPLHGLAPTHRCPACGAFWRQCDDASWNLRSASCCGLCDAGRVELVRWLDEPKREPLSDERIAEIQRAAYERAAQECEPHDDDDSIDRQIKRELAERILALGRQ